MSTSEQGWKSDRIPRADEARSQFDRLWTWLRARIWLVLPERRLAITLSPAASFATLGTAAKPSIDRLQLRNVFARGRRYYLDALPDGGFRMVTTNKMPLYGRRTTAAAVLHATFEPQADGVTGILLRARFKLLYFLDIFFIPAFMISMLIFMPWPIWSIVWISVMLLVLSWIGHQTHARLEVHAMLYFIEKALEDHISEAPPALFEKSADVTITRQQDFPAVWEKFYEEMTENTPS